MIIARYVQSSKYCLMDADPMEIPESLRSKISYQRSGLVSHTVSISSTTSKTFGQMSGFSRHYDFLKEAFINNLSSVFESKSWEEVESTVSAIEDAIGDLEQYLPDGDYKNALTETRNALVVAYMDLKDKQRESNADKAQQPKF